MYAAQRLVLISVTAVVVSSIVFIGIHQLPGNALASERRNNPATEAALLHHYNLDVPWPQQYVLWVQGLAHGDMGESLVNMGVQITPLLLREARVSVTLGLAAVLITIGVGLTLGTIAAIRQNTWIDYVASTSAVVGYSVPSFVWAFLLILLTVSGFYAWTGGLVYENIGWGKIEQIPVPALALGLPYAAIVARLTRASMLEVIRQDYVRTARAKGLGERAVVYRHALTNSLLPVVTFAGWWGGRLLGGIVIVEIIFSVPGAASSAATTTS